MPQSFIGRRFYYGFAAATIVCMMLGHVFLLRSLNAIEREGAERSLLIAAHALADVVERAPGDADVQRAVRRFAGLHTQVRGVQVVRTAPGNGAVEKVARWFEDRGDSVVSVTVPFERGGQVVGEVQVEGFVELLGVGLFDPPISLLLLFFLISFLGQRRHELAIGTALLLCTFFLQQARYAERETDSRRERMARQTVEALATESERAQTLLAEIGAPPARLDPLSWDTDSHGRPSGLAISPGELDPAKLAGLKEADGHRRFWPSLALSLLGFTIAGVAGFYRTGRERPEVTEPDEATA